ncbi:hypothetical protein ACFL42_04810 [Candidatus Omnitrophota bacterium]
MNRRILDIVDRRRESELSMLADSLEDIRKKFELLMDDYRKHGGIAGKKISSQ